MTYLFSILGPWRKSNAGDREEYPQKYLVKIVKLQQPSNLKVVMNLQVEDSKTLSVVSYKCLWLQLVKKISKKESNKCNLMLIAHTAMLYRLARN